MTRFASDSRPAAARIWSTVSSSVRPSAARTSSQARTEEHTALAAPGTAATLPIVARAPRSTAASRAASTVAA